MGRHGGGHHLSHGHYRKVSYNTGGKGLSWPPPILFYNRDENYYEFTNFFMRTVIIDELAWRSTEHYFQAQKFVGTPHLEEIRKVESPRQAFERSRIPKVSRWRRPDWDKVKQDVMYKAVLEKFTQHSDLNDLLVHTGCRELIENSPTDYYWGCGADQTGQNNLGKILMEVRLVLSGSKNSSQCPSEQGSAQDPMISQTYTQTTEKLLLAETTAKQFSSPNLDDGTGNSLAINVTGHSAEQLLLMNESEQTSQKNDLRLLPFKAPDMVPEQNELDQLSDTKKPNHVLDKDKSNQASAKSDTGRVSDINRPDQISAREANQLSQLNRSDQSLETLNEPDQSSEINNVGQSLEKNKSDELLDVIRPDQYSEEKKQDQSPQKNYSDQLCEKSKPENQLNQSREMIKTNQSPESKLNWSPKISKPDQSLDMNKMEHSTETYKPDQSSENKTDQSPEINQTDQLCEKSKSDELPEKSKEMSDQSKSDELSEKSKPEGLSEKSKQRSCLRRASLRRYLRRASQRRCLRRASQKRCLKRASQRRCLTRSSQITCVRKASQRHCLKRCGWKSPEMNKSRDKNSHLTHLPERSQFNDVRSMSQSGDKTGLV